MINLPCWPIWPRAPPECKSTGRRWKRTWLFAPIAFTISPRGQKTLSVSLSLAWIPDVSRHMGNWIDDVNAQLEKRKQERERADKLALNNAEIIERKGDVFFADFMQNVQAGIAELSTKRPELSRLRFIPKNVFAFEVMNDVYPVVNINVQHIGSGIKYTESVIDSARVGPRIEHHEIDLRLDQNDNLCLFRLGQPVANRDELIKLMFAHAFRL